jgi:hypothetical protein
MQHVADTGEAGEPGLGNLTRQRGQLQFKAKVTSASPWTISTGIVRRG